MKLSTKEQYAIQAMMYLAVNFKNKPITLLEISGSQTISLSYLEQLFAILRNANLIEGVRGPGGGYRLGRSPELISITDIITSIEESTNKSAKELDKANNVENPIANQLWLEFSNELKTFLDSITLSHIVKDHVGIKHQFHLDETTQRISSMFPVTPNLKVA